MKRRLSAFLVAGSLASPLAPASARADEAATPATIEALIQATWDVTARFVEQNPYNNPYVTKQLDATNHDLVSTCGNLTRKANKTPTFEWKILAHRACVTTPLIMGHLEAKVKGYDSNLFLLSQP